MTGGRHNIHEVALRSLFDREPVLLNLEEFHQWRDEFPATGVASRACG